MGERQKCGIRKVKRQTLEKENEVRFTPRQVYGWKQEEKAKRKYIKKKDEVGLVHI